MWGQKDLDPPPPQEPISANVLDQAPSQHDSRDSKHNNPNQTQGHDNIVGGSTSEIDSTTGSSSSSYIESAPSMTSSFSRDPVLTALQDNHLNREKLDSLIESFSDIDAEDVTCAWSILSTINRYTDEVQSWPDIDVLDTSWSNVPFDSARSHRPTAQDTRSPFSFASFLSNPSAYSGFSKPFSHYNNSSSTSSSTALRPVQIDIVSFISRRAQGLLNELASWDIDILKARVHSLPAFHSDAATLLTMLVLRILSTFSRLQVQLQMALSKATFARVHYELTALLTNVSSNSKETNPLILKYRSFVAQLLTQVENAPVESVQEMVFIAQDLQRMFAAYAASYEGSKPASSPSPGPQTYNLDPSSPFKSSMPSIMQAFESAKYEAGPSSTLALMAASQKNHPTQLNSASPTPLRASQPDLLTRQQLHPLHTRPKPAAPGSINLQKWLA